jgi:hypothetical protein
VLHTREDLIEVARKEAKRSIDRVRIKWPKIPTAAEARHAVEALTPFHTDPAISEQAFRLALFSRQTRPPPRADNDKWGCADEAFYLVDTLCTEPPSGDRGGCFMLITELLYEGLTGQPAGDADLYRACLGVLAQRRKSGLGTLNQT